MVETVWKCFLIVTVVAFVQIDSAAAASYDDSYNRLLANLTRDPRYQDALLVHFKRFRSYSQDLEEKFNCEYEVSKCTTKPKSVHELHPCHVGVVAALGDSITAGNGAKASNVLEVLIQYRGVSWSIGGDSPINDVHTLPNILKRYNPRVRGFSLQTGPVSSPNSHLNVAVPGATSANMQAQAEMLVDRLHSEPGIHFLSDWKVVTIFVGANNLCNYCTDEVKNGAEQYVKDIQATLDYLHENVPRMFVNLVQVVSIGFVHTLNKGPICNFVHMLKCGCAEKPKWIPELEKQVIAYRGGLNTLIASGRYDTKDDFTVVIQPFLVKSSPAKAGSDEPDLSYFAPDCFHFSQKGHTAAAYSLWNNMLQPLGSKDEDWKLQKGVVCPQEGQYFSTSKNGKQAKLDQVTEHAGGGGHASVVIASVTCAVIVTAVVAGLIRYKRVNGASRAERLYLLQPESGSVSGYRIEESVH